MHAPEAFYDLLMLLLIAVGAAAIFLRLRLPAVLGYLAVGLAAGPSAFALVSDVATIRSLAELGVVLLLFTIGLEFSLPALARMRGALLGLGGAEVLIASIVTFLAARAMEIPVAGSVVLGGVVAMSSTALVTKQLADQVELGEAHGRSALGVLLFQDLAVVPFLVIVSGLANPGEATIPMALGMALLKGTLALGAILLAGRYLLRPALAGVAALQSRELFTLTALGVALGAAWLTASLSLSPALGAFVAGIMLGESPYRHTIEAEIRPFRDVLLALFFVSIGMLLDLSIVPVALPWILLLFAALVVFKFVLVFALCRIARMPVEAGARTALVLAHGGEFGFALLTIALDGDLLPADYGQAILAALLLSMGVAPLALRFNRAIVQWFLPAPAGGTPGEMPPGPGSEARHDVLLVGFGRVGQQVARLLDDAGISWRAIDVDPIRVENARASGAAVTYGDGMQLDLLEAAGLRRVRALVLSNDDPEAAARTIRQVRTVLPELPILVRAPDDGHLNELLDAGATEIVPETLEASLMLASQLMFALGQPTDDVMRRIRAVRHDRYDMLRALFPGSDDADPERLEMRAVTLPAAAAAAGRPLNDLGLENEGVRLASLTRAGRRLDAPRSDEILTGGDVLTITGTPAALDRAEARLIHR
jgi:CPA2 family monovalent cation:H+ antiporter-2